MKTFPTLHGERLLLNQLEVADIPAIIEQAGHAQIAATTATIPHPYYEKDAIHWIDIARQGFQREEHYIFAIREKEQQKFIGGIELRINKTDERASLGYWVAVPFWNKGYATEATSVLLKFGFEVLHLNKIHAIHLIENPASGKVLLHNGMRQEGILKEHLKQKGAFKTIVQYGLTRSDFKPSL
ncbi:MAG: GNAT family N-acetyltransferase [Aureispira sp.]